MTPQELKNSILQLAIQGKLVEQRPEESTGEELYRQIQAEKQRLIKEGTIKKEKPLPEIAEDEKPFEIPESWTWVRFGSVINIVSARRVHQSDWKKTGIPFYRAREIAKLAVDGYVDNELFISHELYEEFSKSGVPQPGDLMVTAVGTLGKTYIVQSGDQFYYKDASVICLENYSKLSPEFLKYIMQSEMMMNQIRSNSSGTTVATLTMVRMVEYIFPLPPIAEQKRIVAKIEELLPYIDRYEKAWSKLEDFNKRFPADMQKALLQMAIQGGLVEQRPEEGTGEELYRQIQTEKQRLIKAGTIKKDKPLPEIAEEEIPFDIPENWTWVRIGTVAVLNPKNDLPDNMDTSFIPMTLIHDGFRNHHTFEVKKWNDIKKGFTHFANGDVGVAKITPCFQNRKSVIFRNLHNGYGAGTTELTVIRAISGTVLPEYLLWFFKTDYFISNGVQSFTGTAGQQRLHKDYLATCLMPLPPLDEQKRIVAKLEELLPLCERLK